MRPCIVNRAASRTHVTHERAAALISSPQQLTESRHPSSCGKHVSEITCIQPSSSLTGAMGSCAPLAHRARVSSCVLWAWLSSPSGQYWRRQPYLVNEMIKGFHSYFVNEIDGQWSVAAARKVREWQRRGEYMGKCKPPPTLTGGSVRGGRWPGWPSCLRTRQST